MTTLTTAKPTTLTTGKRQGNLADSLSAAIKSLTMRTFTAYEVAAERRALSKLTPDQLSDIGISQAQAQHESNRSFLDIPKR